MLSFTSCTLSLLCSGLFLFYFLGAGFWKYFKGPMAPFCLQGEIRRQVLEVDDGLEELSLLLDNIETLVWYMKDPETIGIINQAQADFLSLKKEQVEGASLYELFPPQTARTYIEENLFVFKKKEQLKIDTWTRKNNGEKRLLSIIKTPKLDERGEVELIICSAQDITEKWQVQEKLRQSEKRFRAIIEDQTELICRFLPGGILTFVNEAYCQYFSKERDQLLGKSFMPLIPEADQGISERHVAALSLENPVTNYEHRVILPGDEIRWQQWTDRAIFNDSGEIIEYQAVGRDITQQKKAEEALQKAHDDLERRVLERTQELEEVNRVLRGEVKKHQQTEKMLAAEKERLAVTLSSIGDGVITTDTQGFIEMINAQAVRITGWSSKEAIGRKIQEVLTLTGELDASSFFSRENSGQDTLLMRKDGKTRFLFHRSAPIEDREGFTVGHVVVFSDITEKKRLEEQKVLSQKLESIGRLTAGIAHEINTPLHYIRENNAFLSESFQELKKYLEASSLPHSTGGERLEYLKKEIPLALSETEEGIHLMNGIISSMQNFAHPGREKKELADLNQAIESTVNISRNEWKYVADVELDLDGDLPLVPCTINEINQVILNLIINAAQAIEEKGEKGRIQITTRVQEGKVQLVICDTGTGIQKDIQDRLFDPFFTTKGVGKGTGQGLSIAYDIVVNKHSGEIQVQSQLHEGTSLIILLPL